MAVALGRHRPSSTPPKRFETVGARASASLYANLEASTAGRRPSSAGRAGQVPASTPPPKEVVLSLGGLSALPASRARLTSPGWKLGFGNASQ
ncbi:unnamed protein product, partial [Polarella glacialis]